MSHACSLGLAPGMIGDSNIMKCGPMAPRRRQSQTAFGPWWPITIAACAILTSGGVAAQDAAQIERGRKLFMEQAFNGNGRTCATCHPPTNNFTVDPAWIRTLKGNDPIFLTGPSMPELKSIEVRNLLRNNALFLENVDGLDQPGVLRSAPHTLALRLSRTPDGAVAAEKADATGWSGDGSPDDGSFKSFAKGAVIQHFTKSANRVEGVDFRLPTDQELDDMEAFQLSLGRQEEVNIDAFEFSDQLVEDGKALFKSAPTRNGTGSCDFCHNNAGAMAAAPAGVNRNFATGTNRNANVPACLAGFVAPFDGGFGVASPVTLARADVCGKGPKGGPKATSTYQGDMTMNTPPLIEAADTPPLFHNNSAATIEDAVAFYTSDAFHASPGSAGGGGAFVLSEDEINQIAAFLRALNALENIRSSNAYDDRATQAVDPNLEAPAEFLVELAIAETTDAIEVLTEGPIQLFADAVDLLREARELERQALAQTPPDPDLLQDAILSKDAAREAILEPAP